MPRGLFFDCLKCPMCYLDDKQTKGAKVDGKPKMEKHNEVLSI